MITVGIHGAAGRMGQRLVALAHEDSELQVTVAIDAAGHPSAGRDAGEVAGVGKLDVPIAAALAGAKPQVMIDFSVPVACRSAIELCVQQRIPLVIGTTGLTEDDLQKIAAAGKTIPILQAPNMSLGVNLLFALAAQVARQLGDDYDIEIVEGHHRFKKDAPSGTALGIARSICNATGKDLQRDVVHGRHGDDVVRKRGEIGMHALRLGDEVGRHTVSYATLGEELQLTHTASTRDVFARGALRAAKWLVKQQPGRYGMADVLGLKA